MAAMLTIGAPLKLLKMGFSGLGVDLVVFGGSAAAAAGADMAGDVADAAPTGGGATDKINDAGKKTSRLSNLFTKLKGIVGSVGSFIGKTLKVLVLGPLKLIVKSVTWQGCLYSW